jgi:monoamine oxidase
MSVIEENIASVAKTKMPNAESKVWQVIIIGSGFAGLGAAIKLREAGIH